MYYYPSGSPASLRRRKKNSSANVFTSKPRGEKCRRLDLLRLLRILRETISDDGFSTFGLINSPSNRFGYMRLLAAIVAWAAICPVISSAAYYRPVLTPLPLQSTLKTWMPRVRDWREDCVGGGLSSDGHSRWRSSFIWPSPVSPTLIVPDRGEWLGAEMVTLLGKSLRSATVLKIQCGPDALLICQGSDGAILRDAYTLICEAMVAGGDDDLGWRQGEKSELTDFKKRASFEPTSTFIFEGAQEAQIELDTVSLRMVVVSGQKWRSVQIDRISVAAIDELIKRAVSHRENR